MISYRRKPILTHCFQWTGVNILEARANLGDNNIRLYRDVEGWHLDLKLNTRGFDTYTPVPIGSWLEYRPDRGGNALDQWAVIPEAVFPLTHVLESGQGSGGEGS